MLFRKVIRKTKPQIASELEIDIEKVVSIETGTQLPEISILHYLASAYGLNLNWLLAGKGSMFIETPPNRQEEPGFENQMGPKPGMFSDITLHEIQHIPDLPCMEEHELSEDRKRELLGLLQVPVIEKAVMDALADLLKKLKKDL